jgi:hypothetical protein
VAEGQGAAELVETAKAFVTQIGCARPRCRVWLADSFTHSTLSRRLALWVKRLASAVAPVPTSLVTIR